LDGYLTSVLQVLMIGLLLGIGLIIRRFKVIDDIGQKQITSIIINITFPALIISASLVSFSKEVFNNGISLILIGSIIRIFWFVLALGTFKFFTRSKEDKYLYIFMLSYSNSGFLGMAIVVALYGSDAALLSALFNLPQEILLWSVGVWMLKKGAGIDSKFEWKNFLATPTIFAVIALIIYCIPFHDYPKFVTTFFNYVGIPTIFLSTAMLGSQLYTNNPDITQNKKGLLFLLLFKLLVFPIAAFIVLRMLKFDELSTNIAVILTAMPPPSSGPVLAANFGIKSKFGGTVTIVLTLAMLLTLPIVLYILHQYKI